MNSLEQSGQKLTFLKLSDFSDLFSISHVSDVVLTCPVPMVEEEQITGATRNTSETSKVAALNQ